MNKAIKIIREFKKQCLINNFDLPREIHISEKMAKEIKSDLQMMIRYSSKESYRSNEILWHGIILVAPAGFTWTGEE